MQDCGQNWYCNHFQIRVYPRLLPWLEVARYAAVSSRNVGCYKKLPMASDESYTVSFFLLIVYFRLYNKV